MKVVQCDLLWLNEGQVKNSGFLQNFLTHNLSFVNKSHHIFTKSEVKDSKVFGEEQYQLTVIHFQDKNVNFGGFYNMCHHTRF